MALPRTFAEAGISTALPGQYIKQEFPSAAGGAGTGRTVYVIGSAAGGVPYSADVPEEERRNLMGTVADVKNLLRSGPGRFASEFAIDPTNEPGFQGPPAVGFIRVDPALPATEYIKDGAAANVIALTTGRYGNLANQVARRVQIGTSVGYRVAVKFLDDLEEQDDVALPLMNLQYVGAGTAATLEVDGTSLIVSVTGASDGITLALADYERVIDLVNYINDLPSYTASIAGTSTESPSIFDLFSGQDILAAPHAISANVEAVVRRINRNSGGELIASVVGDRKALAPDSAFVYCSGGTDGVPSLSDWTGALELAGKIDDLRLLVAASASQSYQVAASDHVREMSKTSEGKNRQMLTGADLVMTDSEQIERARSVLGNERVEFFGTPFKRPNSDTGEVQEWEPFYAAAAVAGLRAGAETTTSAEFKRIIGTGVTRRYRRQEAEALVRAGVSLLEPGPGGSGIAVMANVTCHQGDRTVLTVPSMLTTADEISLDIKNRVRARIAPLREAGNPVIVSEFESWIRIALLPDQVDRRRAVAFRDVQFAVDGDVWRLNFTALIPAPPRFFFSVQKFIPWTVEISG